MKSISPNEYSILYALFQLKSRGINSVTLKDVFTEVNHRRKLNKQKLLSTQLVYYYLSQLAKRPFINRINRKKSTRYTLKHGTWKLNQNPPLCISISNESHCVLPCDKINNCEHKKPTIECLQDLANALKITLPPYF